MFLFIVLGNKDCDMSTFKFLFHVHVTLTAFSGKIRSILWPLCNADACFLTMIFMLGINGLYCVIKLREVEDLLLFLGLLASPLKSF